MNFLTVLIFNSVKSKFKKILLFLLVLTIIYFAYDYYRVKKLLTEYKSKYTELSNNYNICYTQLNSYIDKYNKCNKQLYLNIKEYKHRIDNYVKYIQRFNNIKNDFSNLEVNTNLDECSNIKLLINQIIQKNNNVLQNIANINNDQ